MREEEISWLSWDAEDVSTLPDMAAVFVVCTGRVVPAEGVWVGRSCYGGV